MAKLIKTSGEVVEVRPSNGKAFSLQELKDFVGGWIECLPCPNNLATIVCNEEGKLLDLPYNPIATEFMNVSFGNTRDYLVGDVLIAEDGEIE